MKRLMLAAAFVVAAFLYTSAASAQAVPVFTGVTANTDTTTMATPPSGSYLGVFACGARCSWRLWSSTGSSTATVNAYCRISSSDSEPWYLCDTVSNPGSPGSDRSLPREHDYKFTVEGYSAGTIHIKFFHSSTP